MAGRYSTPQYLVTWHFSNQVTIDGTTQRVVAAKSAKEAIAQVKRQTAGSRRLGQKH